MERVKVQSILNRQKTNDGLFLSQYTLNPYYGCPYKCLYCYVHGSKYGSKMPAGHAVKSNGPELLRGQLRSRAQKKEYGIIALGSSADPYPPAEEELKYTMRMLELILAYRFPVEVLTKSTLVARDIGLLKEIGDSAILSADLQGELDHGAIVSFSFSTTDDRDALIFEPGAPLPSARLETMKKCKDAGLMVGANFIPVLPFISDTEENIDRMIKAVKEHGADYVLMGGLTLFGDKEGDSKVKYYHALEQHYPELVHAYDGLFRNSFAPPRSYQAQVEERARKSCERHGIRYGIL